MTDIPLDSPCPCGSGNAYIRCCGYCDLRIWGEHALGRMPGKLTDPPYDRFVAREPRCRYLGEPMPPGFLIRQLDDHYDWRDIAAFVKPRQDARPALTNQGDLRRKSIGRETEIVDPGDRADSLLTLVRELFRKEAEPFFRRRLRSLEAPQILRYSPGGYYRPHADSDELNYDTNKWEKKLDRDLSLLLYLDDDYSGGEISFPNFEFKLRPRPGTLLIFPSDCRYLHGVLPVTEGVRHTIVSWCALQATK